MVVFEAPQVPVGQHPLDCGQHPGPSPGLASPLVQHTVHPADARRAKQGHSSVSPGLLQLILLVPPEALRRLPAVHSPHLRGQRHRRSYARL